jgi:signal transduction histidine kinase
MRFRMRVLLALVALALAPLIAIAIGVRHEIDRRLTAGYEARAASLAAGVGDELAHESGAIAERLSSLREAMIANNRLRLGLSQREPSDRAYLLDYAGDAMRLAGLSMLQIEDSTGRILSSGHFRNEFDRLEPDLPMQLAAAPGGAALVDARTADGPRRVIARVDSLRVGGRRITLVGGTAVDARFLRALAPDSEFSVALVTDSSAAPRDAAELSFPFVVGAERTDSGRRSLHEARFVITHSNAELIALRRSVDKWFVAAVVFGVLTALIGAGWLAGQVSRPLSRLADLTSNVDLDRLDVAFATDRRDEVGDLSRLLDAMTRRLRASAIRLREAEHRATVGDLAGQVNHDVKNGLVPIRHVLRHLAQIEREDPQQLATVFSERRATLDASVDYLDALARNYARLSRPIVREPCDLNALVRVAAASAAADDRVSVRLELDPHTPIISTDALVVRRILDNLVSNAMDAAGSTGGAVTIGTRDRGSRVGSGSGDSGAASIVVSDTGPGMTEAQLARAFDDFHTTKPTGTGLGLSIVRRLTSDLGATLHVDTAPGRGTTAEIVFAGGTDRPAAAGR